MCWFSPPDSLYEQGVHVERAAVSPGQRHRGCVPAELAQVTATALSRNRLFPCQGSALGVLDVLGCLCWELLPHPWAQQEGRGCWALGLWVNWEHAALLREEFSDGSTAEELLWGISRALRASAQRWDTSLLPQKGNICSDPQPCWQLLVAWGQIIPLSLLFLSWFVFKHLTEKATVWRGFCGQDLSSSRGSLCFLSPSAQHKYDRRVYIFC